MDAWLALGYGFIRAYLPAESNDPPLPAGRALRWRAIGQPRRVWKQFEQ
jgi:hypothetical protein